MYYRSRIVLGVSLATTVMLGAASPSHAQGPPDYDFQWTTIGNVGNAPYTSSNPNDLNVNGRGQVNYAFRASKLEITTGQWMEFLNAFAPLDNSPLEPRGPLNWGAYRATSLPNGHFLMALDPLRPNAAMLPIGGITWRDAARYCNWLQNGKQVTLAAISTGAYDTTTWGGQVGNYTDAPFRMPGAQFFIPNLDEYVKSTHYDPNRYGPGQGGYWQSKSGTDIPPTPGAPGQGQTTGGFRPGGDDHIAWNIPLGSYPDVRTAYGLLDASGGGREWIESFPGQVRVNGRMYAGSFCGSDTPTQPRDDSIGWINASEFFTEPGTAESFRVCSVVPSPSTLPLLVMQAFAVLRRSTRRSDS